MITVIEGRWDKLWSELRARFGILFTIGAALSFVNVLASLQFLIDAWEFLRASVEDAPLLEQIIRIVASVIGAVLDWWREWMQRFLGWLQMDLPPVWIDSLSALSFTAGRGLARYLALRVAQNDAKALAEMHAERAREVARQQSRRVDISGFAGLAAAGARIAARRVPLETVLTVALLAGFFLMVYAIDYWYRAL